MKFAINHNILDTFLQLNKQELHVLVSRPHQLK